MSILQGRDTALSDKIVLILYQHPNTLYCIWYCTRKIPIDMHAQSWGLGRGFTLGKRMNSQGGQSILDLPDRFTSLAIGYSACVAFCIITENVRLIRHNHRAIAMPPMY